MDRDNRLSQIKETDLTESRLNEEFVTWLKTKGLNWLLLVLLALLGWMGWNLWQQRQAESRDVAWEELAAATLPVSLEEVAVRHGAIDSVAAMAYLSAGDRYLSSIQNGVRFDRTADQLDYRLDAETRVEFLESADASYRKAIEALESMGPDPDGNRAPLLMAAWFGRAAIAESRGDLEATEAALRKGREVASDRFPKVVVWADRRIEDLPNLANPLPIPRQADLPARETLAPLAPSVADDLMRELMAPPPAAPAVEIETPSTGTDAPAGSAETSGGG